VIAMRILLVSRIDNQDALVFAEKIKALLEKGGSEVVFERDTARSLDIPGQSLEDSHTDAVIIIGGDGTILRTIQQMERPVPVLGINWGEVGFLADLEPSEALEFVRKLEYGFPVEERMRITLSDDSTCLGTALNEALIVTSRPAKMLKFSIIIDGVTTEQFRADGLLISTPTGSTAYAMSAGGPIVDPRVDGTVIVPLAPFKLSARPWVVPAKSEIRMELILPKKEAVIVIDGQFTRKINYEDKIHITRAEKPARFVKTKKDGFYDKVRSKLAY